MLDLAGGENVSSIASAGIRSPPISAKRSR